MSDPRRRQNNLGRVFGVIFGCALILYAVIYFVRVVIPALSDERITFTEENAEQMQYFRDLIVASGFTINDHVRSTDDFIRLEYIKLEEIVLGLEVDGMNLYAMELAYQPTASSGILDVYTVTLVGSINSDRPRLILGGKSEVLRCEAVRGEAGTPATGCINFESIRQRRSAAITVEDAPTDPRTLPLATVHLRQLDLSPESRPLFLVWDFLENNGVLVMNSE